MAADWHVGAFVKALERNVERVDAAVRIVVAESAHALEAEVKKSFTQAHAKGTPTPAGRGQPPAVVTGTLRRSVHVEGPKRLGFGTYQAEVGPTVVYACRQELDPAYDHPYFAPSYARWSRERDLQRRLTRAVREAIR